MEIKLIKFLQKRCGTILFQIFHRCMYVFILTACCHCLSKSCFLETNSNLEIQYSMTSCYVYEHVCEANAENVVLQELNIFGSIAVYQRHYMSPQKILKRQLNLKMNEHLLHWMTVFKRGSIKVQKPISLLNASLTLTVACITLNIHHMLIAVICTCITIYVYVYIYICMHISVYFCVASLRPNIYLLTYERMNAYAKYE